MKQRSPLLFIFLTVFIDLLGVGIILPLLPYYVKIIEGSTVPWLAENRAFVVGALGASFALMQFICAPMLGALSDRFGRRPVLLLSLLGTGLSYVVMALATALEFLSPEMVLALLFTARIMDGITGGNISIAQAYIADVTKPEERAKGMGMIGAAFGLGFMLGPAIGGLLSTVSLEAPALAAAALSLGSVLFGYFALPESLPAERRTQLTIRGVNPLAQLGAVIGAPAIQPLLIGIFLLNLAFAALQSNFAVYSDERFGFTALDNALVFALVGLVAVVVQGFLIRRLLPRLGEERMAIGGVAIMAVAFALIAIAPQAWMLFPAVALLAVGSGASSPSITGLISRRVGAQEQGRTLGGVQALNSLTMVTGPLLAGFMFDAVGATAPYIAGAALAAAAGVVVAAALNTRAASASAPEVAHRPIGTSFTTEAE